VPIIEGFLTREIVEEVRHILENRVYREKMVEHNYQVAARHYSYGVLRRFLRALIVPAHGTDIQEP